MIALACPSPRVAVGARRQMATYKPIPSFTPTQIARFWAKVDKSGTGGCWRWTGKLTPNGYGTFYDFRAHRIAFTLVRGVVPAEKTLDHICRNRACVNPDHLEIVTNKVNILRGTSPTAINARRTHCKKGHEFDAVDTYGRRHCSSCRKAYKRSYNIRPDVRDEMRRRLDAK